VAAVSVRLILLTHFFMALALALCLMTGCGQPAKTAAQLEASELLALLQERQNVDAKTFVEMNLGRFRVTHKLPEEDHLYVQFHLYGVLPEHRKVRFSEVWPKYEKRVRDAVLSLTQRIETEHLCDPSLTYFKEEVAGAINRILQERLLADVAFSDFSTDREAGMPWSVPAVEAKPSGGGHGH
jgi:hypothetical protein